jgi:hypothetical protein
MVTVEVMSDLLHLLSEFASDFPEIYTPDISDNYKGEVVKAIAEAVILIRTHALDPDHPLAID